MRARLSNALHLVGFFFVSWLQQPLGAIRLEIVHLMCPSSLDEHQREREARRRVDLVARKNRSRRDLQPDPRARTPQENNHQKGRRDKVEPNSKEVAASS